MTAKFFVDTNVLVYARDPSEPVKQAAAQRWLATLQTDELARLSYQIIQEYYHVVTRKLSPALSAEIARADVRDFLDWKPIVPSPGLIKTAWQVQDAYAMAWWDCMVLAAAITGNCRFLLSEDFSADRDYNGVRVVNPFVTGPAEVLR